ncbi:MULTISPECIES: hypothetical protein [Pseudoalteromonas]|uniref:Defensin-like protein n=1 Tax=Pseudoalteromonas obscura TaxID=3048491 RepID=A0ABT7EK16_9GAMM|nr:MULTISPECIES: hypothetical protein [Pseudoalteromonas]MBQ4836947.1 hypothetical protein [Pseudoalteromonas luteoviolacea]MDK2595379.1 hypothetical protein [Pseudoalteromonas sp. P94(2023)]
MKLNLKKKSFKSLSANNQNIPKHATPAIGGGRFSNYCNSNNLGACTQHCYSKTLNDTCNSNYVTFNGTGCCETTIC